MNSFNHYAYGAIGDWMYRVVAGIEIDPSAPAYKHILIQPQPGGGLTSVKASVESMYGRVESGWKIADGKIAVNVEVPANTTATLRLPKAKLEEVRERGKALGEKKEFFSAREVGDSVVIDLGSGSYLFESLYTAPEPPKPQKQEKPF
jgi:alpha-L-rhamnosidase